MSFIIKNSSIKLLICLVILVTGVTGQTSTTGTLEGVVTDPSGAVLTGATVKMAGPNLIRPQTVISDNQGRYRFPNLPPGRYIVTVEPISGFSKYELSNIDISLSKATTLDIKMTVQGATVTVNVVGDTGAAIDLTSTTAGSNLSTEQFSNIPTQRTVQSLFFIAPTAARSGLRDMAGRDRDPSVMGASGPENNYILDGINTTDPAFGGSGANLPFEFIQSVEVKTGAYGAEYGKSTGGVFNVVTKSGTNQYHGDIFFYGNPKRFTRETKQLPFTGSAANGYAENDTGVTLGGPIVKDKLLFFGAFDYLRRTNYLLTQTFRNEEKNTFSTPFYAGRVTYAANNKHIFNFSTFGDFTKVDGFFFTGSGFGADPDTFRGLFETGGHNYTARLNSSFTPNFTGEFVFSTHLQRNNVFPRSSVDSKELIVDNFAVVKGGGVLAPVNTSIVHSDGLTLAYVNGTGGSLSRNYARQGFGIRTNQNRDRYEFAGRMENYFGNHTLKYGYEYANNRYTINTRSTGPTRDFGATTSGIFNGYRLTNRFVICNASGASLVCPNDSTVARGQSLLDGGALASSGITSVSKGAVNLSTIANPFLILGSVRVRDFRLNTRDGNTTTAVQSGYIQDYWKITRTLQINPGVRWDFQTAKSLGTTYLKLNKFFHNTQPRIGFIWDFTGRGKGKLTFNYARSIETPIPLDLNVRAGGNSVQTDFNLNINRLNGPAGSTTLLDIGNLGGDATPIDPGLKPQSLNEFITGLEVEVANGFTLGMRGIYKTQDNVIEDGSFDDGTTYFIFNPGRRYAGSTEDKACSDPTIGCFGRARRYYRALEFTANKRFAKNWQLISSYVYSSLIGNYEGLFRNDNGQSDPNITSLFDLVSLLKNSYGRLPNDRPHQLKLDGTYVWRFGLSTSSSFRVQSGIPFNALIPHIIYGDNEGFDAPRGTAVNPVTGEIRTPVTFGVDFGAHYSFNFGDSKKLKIGMDWFNMFNNQRAVTQDTTLRINSGSTGIPAVDNPFFGSGMIFQTPSAVRLSAKFSF